MASAESGVIAVEVIVHSAVNQTRSVQLALPEGASIQDALVASGLWSQGSTPDAPPPKVGVWGQLRSADHRLRDLDRVEVYRALRIDPMEARRQRQRAAAKKRQV